MLERKVTTHVNARPVFQNPQVPPLNHSHPPCLPCMLPPLDFHRPSVMEVNEFDILILSRYIRRGVVRRNINLTEARSRSVTRNRSVVAHLDEIPQTN